MKPRKLQVPAVGTEPHQPSSPPFKFPRREFWKKNVVKKSFFPQWFQRWPWLHYCEDMDAAFCFICVNTYSEKKLNSVSNLETTCISSGYTNWKDTCVKFPNHESSRCHKNAVVLKTRAVPTRDESSVITVRYAVKELPAFTEGGDLAKFIRGLEVELKQLKVDKGQWRGILLLKLPAKIKDNVVEHIENGASNDDLVRALLTKVGKSLRELEYEFFPPRRKCTKDRVVRARELLSLYCVPAGRSLSPSCSEACCTLSCRSTNAAFSVGSVPGARRSC